MTKKLIPAVGYARRSTDMQERSIPDQQAYVERWAKEHGYTIKRWFIDDAISGTSARGRNAFEQLIGTAENGRDFETILCYDISRFSRGGTNETGYYLHRLNLAGVNVQFTADAIPEGDEGELIQGVKSWQARQYSIKLARDSIRGQLSNLKERKSAPGGQPPYGYDKQHLTPDGKVLRTLRWMPDNTKLEIAPDGAVIRTIASDVYVAKAKGDIVRLVPSTPDRVQAIRRMFELCVQGYGYLSIAKRMNEEGIPTMFGRHWNMSNIAQMLHNPVYCGALVYNKRTEGSLFGMSAAGALRPKKGKRGSFKNANEDWVVIPDVHEPLISQKTFDAAQAAMAKRRFAGGKARSVRRTLVSTLLICKRCGSSFTTVRDTRRRPEFGPPYRHYTCAGYHRGGKKVCGLVRIPGQALDAFVLGLIRQSLQGDAKTRKQAIDAFVKGMAKQAEAPDTSTVRREVEQLNRRIKATVTLLADPTFEGIDDLPAVLADLKRKRDALQGKLATATASATPSLTPEQLRDWANEQFDKLERMADKEEVDLADRQLVEAFVQRIEINPDAKTGVVILHADLHSVLASTRVLGGDKPRTDEPRRWFRWSLMLGLLGMTAMLFLSRLDHPLLEPEEGRYAEIPRQMLAEGRFLTPVLHGEDYLQKPPLLYWLVMLNYQIFGVHDWAARLVPCLAGIASVMLVTLWARRTMGFWTGLVSGAILALSGRFLYIAGMLNMDGVLCACVVAALASVHLAIASQTNRWRWIIASSVACAIGVLTKGPVAIVLVAVPLIALALLDRRVKVLSLLESAAYGGIVVGVAAPWYAYMAINDSEAAGTFVWLHNLQRYLAPFDHEKPTWYYLPSLFLGMMPWTLLAIPLARYLWQRTQAAQRRRPAALGFAILAFAWCVLFFSLSGCKRPAYVLPAFPLGAIVLATCLTHAFPWRHWMRNGYRLHAAGHGWARALLVATLGLGAFLGAAAAIVELWPWQAAVATAFCLGGVWFLFGFPARAKPVWMSWAGSTVLAFLVLILAQRTLLPGYHDRFGVRRQAAICAEYEQEDLPILTYPKRWDSVSFYTQRGDVASYAPADLAQLHHDLRRHGKAIIFVRRDGSLNELRQALPDSMRLEVIGHRQDFITVALVRAR